ncbi:MAG: hypothetical protein ACM3PY_19405, partial [Omnitrophica WOR_2 bacterium]
MNDNSRRILLAVLVFILAACVCLGIFAAAGAGLFILKPSRVDIFPSAAAATSAPIPSGAPTSTIEQTSIPSPTANLPSVTLEPTITTTQASISPGVSPDIASQMDQIQQQVIQLRGLPAKRP